MHVYNHFNKRIIDDGMFENSGSDQALWLITDENK